MSTYSRTIHRNIFYNPELISPLLIGGQLFGTDISSASGSITTLSGLTDVLLTTPATGQFLKYNGSLWVNGSAPTGSGGGSLPDGTNYSDYIFWDTLSSSWGVGGDTVHLGSFAGLSGQTQYNVAIGYESGLLAQGASGNYAVAIGYQSGRTNQMENSTALGTWAGYQNQGSNAVAVGIAAGYQNQGSVAVAMGDSAGATSQGQYAVGLGFVAGGTNQGQSAVAVGYNAGNTNQGQRAVAVGVGAGKINQGQNSIAIGASAGETGQPANSIVLNATNTTLSGVANGFVVKPVRSATASSVLYYDTSSNEITYGAAAGGLSRTSVSGVASYNVSGTGDYIIATRSTTITFPATCDNQMVIVVDNTPSGDLVTPSITLSFPGSNLNDGSASATLNQGQRARLVSVANKWYNSF